MGNGDQIELTEWGWSEKGGEYIPVLTDDEAVPKHLLKIIRFKCKTSCTNRQCTCRANGLECTNACEVCRGKCKNISTVLEETE